MKKEKCVFTVMAFVCIAGSVFAQDSLKKKELNEVVIAATRTEKSVNDVGRSISVITSDDIKNSGATSVAELLTQQEGIYVVGAGQNPGMTSSIFTRGANSNQTVILIDGVRITDPSAINNSIDVSELALANIARIEIVRGAHSTLYGSSAIGGVVNIITKKAEKPGLSLDAGVSGGSFGENTFSLAENIYIAYALKSGFYASAEISNEMENGLNATLDTITNTAVYKHADKSDDFKKLDWVAKAGFKNTKLDAFVSYKQGGQLTDIDKSAYRDDDNYTLDFSRKISTLGATYKITPKLNASLSFGVTQMKRVVIDDSSAIDNLGNTDQQYSIGTYKGNVMNSDVQLNYAMKGLNAVFGGSMYSEGMSIDTRYNSPFYNDTASLDSIKPRSFTMGVFLHVDLGGELINEKAKRFNLGLGTRVSSHSVFGSNYTFEINPSVKLGETGLLYFTYGTGYNAPSLYQLYDPTKYVTWDTQYSTGLTRGNKKLSPETSETIELGFKQKISNVSVSAAYFHTVVDNMIEYVYLWDKNIGIDTLGMNWGRDDFRGDTYINSGKMTTNGVELGFSSIVSEKVLVSGNFSLLSGKLEYNPSDIDTAQTGGNHVQVYNNGSFLNKNVEVNGLSRRPSTANISITYMPIKILRLRADLRYVGSRGDVYYEAALGPYGALGTVSVAPYTLLDLSGSVKIYKGLSAGVRVANVLDAKYAEINGFTTRGRSYYGNIRYSF